MKVKILIVTLLAIAILAQSAFADGFPTHDVSVSISPYSQTANSGQTVTYTVTVTNTGNQFETFSLTTNYGSLSQTSIYLHPGTSGYVTLTVYAPSSTITIVVMASSSFVSNTATASLTVYSTSCVRSSPSIGISPSSQSARAGEQASYTVTVTNNNNPVCGYSNFYLSSQVPTSWNSYLDSSTLSIYPGSSASTTLRVTSQSTSAIGTYYIYLTATGDGFSNTAIADYKVLSSACAVGWTETYRCSGTWRQRAFQNSDCSFTWHNLEDCSLNGRSCSGDYCSGIPYQYPIISTVPVYPSQYSGYCTPQYLSNYRCLGNQRQQLYQMYNCQVNWFTVEICKDGCSDGRCTLPAEDIPLVGIERSFNVEKCKLNSFEFDVINLGLFKSTFNVTYSGTAGKWISSTPSVTLESQEKVTVKAYAQVPCDAEAKEYSFTVAVSDSKTAYGYSSLKVVTPSGITGWFVEGASWIILTIGIIILVVVILYIIFFTAYHRPVKRGDRGEEFRNPKVTIVTVKENN
jgi:hypothetical protein